MAACVLSPPGEYLTTPWLDSPAPGIAALSAANRLCPMSVHAALSLPAQRRCERNGSPGVRLRAAGRGPTPGANALGIHTPSTARDSSPAYGHVRWRHPAGPGP